MAPTESERCGGKSARAISRKRVRLSPVVATLVAYVTPTRFFAGSPTLGVIVPRLPPRTHPRTKAHHVDDNDEETIDEADLEGLEEIEGELDEDDLLEEDLDAIDPDLDDEAIADDDLVEEDLTEDVEDVTVPAADDDDDDEADPDDVEASLDDILKDRLVIEDVEDDEDDTPDTEDRAEGGSAVVPKRPDEFVCQSCFLVKHPSQLANVKKQLCRDCV